ncbi:MAG: glycosyltransferase family 4 protein [Caldilineaceae bacterium]|nr:glycosyltransferase family 4 protein [Caldilineaceae bacterium]
MSKSRTYTFGFLLEQTLGHRTHTQNLQTNVPKDPTVHPLWGPIEWDLQGLAAKIPVYNSNWTVRAGLRARQTLRRMEQQSPLDVLFIHTQVPAVLLSDQMQRLPTIVSLDATPQQYDALGAYYAHARGASWLETWKWRANARCFAKAHHLVAWSDWTKQGLIQEYGVPAEKITVIPPGVNSQAWLRPTARVPQTGPTKILFVGGDLQRKGGDLLIEAFRALRQQGHSTLELHLVTRDPVSSEPGIFAYHQMQPNSPALKDLFYAADIFALPTLGDCLPMVLSEAGAAGLPLIATQVGGIREIVQDGENGFLIPTGDVAALTQALRTLVENPNLRLTLGSAATTFVQQTFDAERNTERLLDLMKSCADQVRVQVRKPDVALRPATEKLP